MCLMICVPTPMLSCIFTSEASFKVRYTGWVPHAISFRPQHFHPRCPVRPVDAMRLGVGMNTAYGGYSAVNQCLNRSLILVSVLLSSDAMAVHMRLRSELSASRRSTYFLMHIYIGL